MALVEVEQAREECRDIRAVRLLRDFLQDMSCGLRQLRHSPGFAAAAVVMLNAA